MNKVAELTKLFNEMKAKIEKSQAEGKHAEAVAMLDEFNELKNELSVAKALENAERQAQFNNTLVKASGMTLEEVQIMNNRILNKMVFGKEMTEEELAFMNQVGTPGQVETTDGKGGYLVPTEQLNRIHELRRNHVALKELCNVFQATTMTGTFPVEVDSDGLLIDFDELSEIQGADYDFAQKKWTVKAKGIIVPLSNSLLADENVKLLDYIDRKFVKRAVRTENKDILAKLETLSKQTITKYKDLKTAINKTLDPDIAVTSVIITNQTGYDYLDQLVDKNGRPLLYENLAVANEKRFAGLPVIVLSDKVLAPETTKTTFYVGDLAEYIGFVERQGVEIATSTHAGFTRNATLLRAMERYDVITLDEGAMVRLEIDTATATE